MESIYVKGWKFWRLGNSFGNFCHIFTERVQKRLFVNLLPVTF